jgi:transposase-like protein
MPRRARRTFTPEFKAEVVLALLRGEQSHAELCRQHLLSRNLLALWKQTLAAE